MSRNCDVLSAGLGACTLDLTSLGLLDVMGRDPVRVVRRGRGNSGVRRGNIEVSLLGSDTSPLRVTATSFLGEVGGDPDGVEEVEDTSEEGKDEEIEEDAGIN